MAAGAGGQAARSIARADQLAGLLGLRRALGHGRGRRIGQALSREVLGDLLQIPVAKVLHEVRHQAVVASAVAEMRELLV